MAGLRTEFEFTLPKGYVGDDGVLHREGVMRLATARDEIEPLRDRSIEGPDDPYLTVLVLARVVTELGALPSVGVTEIEGLFAADLAFLQDLYGIINFGDPADVAELQAGMLANSAPVEVVEAEPTPSDLAATDGPQPTEPTASDDQPGTHAPITGSRRGRIEEVTPSTRS